MRVHTSLTADQVRACAGDTGTWLTVLTLDKHGSHTHPRAFEVVLSGESPRRGASTLPDSDYYAATWDQWGLFLGRLFHADPAARIAGVYDDARDFHWQTGDRFRKGAKIQLCPQHRWIYTPALDAQVCTHRCGAVHRRPRTLAHTH